MEKIDLNKRFFQHFWVMKEILHKDDFRGLKVDMKRFFDGIRKEPFGDFSHVGMAPIFSQLPHPAQHLGDIKEQGIIDTIDIVAMPGTDLFSPELCQFEKGGAVGFIIFEALPGLQISIEKR